MLSTSRMLLLMPAGILAAVWFIMGSGITTIRTGEMPDDARKGLEVKFPQKKIQWLIFAVEKTKGTAQNIGLAEIAVFGHDARE